MNTYEVHIKFTCSNEQTMDEVYEFLKTVKTFNSIKGFNPIAEEDVYGQWGSRDMERVNNLYACIQEYKVWWVIEVNGGVCTEILRELSSKFKNVLVSYIGYDQDCQCSCQEGWAFNGELSVTHIAEKDELVWLVNHEFINFEDFLENV